MQVTGYPTGNGSPLYLSTHPDPAAESSPAVQALLDAGAQIVGKVRRLVVGTSWLVVMLMGAVVVGTGR